MDFLNRIPNWIRWLLVPAASFLTTFIVHLITLIIYGGDNFLLTTFGQGLVGFFYLWAGVLMAPQEKKITSLVLFAIFCILSAMSLQNINYEFELILVPFFGVIGCGIAVYCTFEEIIGNTESTGKISDS